MSKKICLLTDSLGSGGAERVAANMSISLSKKGYEIFIVSMKNNIEYPFEGELYNFGEVKQKYHRVSAFFKFKNYFFTHKFDCIIDHRMRDKFIKELIFSKFIFRKQSVFYCVHSYELSSYFSFLNSPWLASLPHVKNKIFISVCTDIQKKLEGVLHIKSKVIYNYVLKEFMKFDNKIVDYNYIVGVGRLTKFKQFDKLIKCYSQSKLSKNNIKLLILGDGVEKENLESLVSELKLKKFVELMPFKKHPYSLVSHAKALILSSKIEGFPMVLVEALTLKTPVISFDCKSGPNEIIINDVNGLLVENQNEEKLILALNKLIEYSFYNQIKSNTQIGLDKFSEETIVQEWINLLENRI